MKANNKITKITSYSSANKKRKLGMLLGWLAF